MAFSMHYEGTSPQGREIIRKGLWDLKRHLRAAERDFNRHWAKLMALFPARLYSGLLADPGQNLAKEVADYLTQSQQWDAFRVGVQQAQNAFEPIRAWPQYAAQRAVLNLFTKELSHDALVPSFHPSSVPKTSQLRDKPKTLTVGTNPN